MNADEFFEQHSIDEINKKTKISPISLRFIKNKEFDKLPRVKFVGFVRLIEKTYKVDLSELIKEYENYFHENKNGDNKKITNIQKEEIKEKKSYVWILVFVLFILSAFLYINFIKEKNIAKFPEVNNSEKIFLSENNVTKNSEINNSKKSVILENNNTETKQNNIEKSKTNETNISLNTVKIKKTENNITKEYNITIIPKEKVWFKATNIDNNKSMEYLTSNPEILKGNYYIKFGHGNLTIIYNDKNITPNTKKIVRILLKNGKFEYLTKPNKYEK